MDLHIQQMFQRKSNKPTYNTGPVQQPTRSPPNIQRQPRFPPPPPQNQNQYQRGQFQNPNQAPNDRQYNRNYDQKQTGQRNQYNPKFNRNQFRQQYQSQQQHQPQYNNQQAYQQRGNNRGQFQNRENPQNQYRDQRGGYNQEQQQFQNQPYQRRQSPSPNQQQQQQPQQNNRKYVPKNQYQGRGNQFQNMDQDQMMQMMKFMAQQYGSQGQNPPRGRGRGRGSRGRSPTRVHNQHQRPYKSELDQQQNRQRMQKFVNHNKPQSKQTKPTTKRTQSRQPKKKGFIKRDQESESIRQRDSESQRSYSDQDEQSQSYSRSQYSDEGQEYSDQGQKQGEQQEDYSDENEQQIQQKDYSESQSLPLDDSDANAINEMCSKQQFKQRLATFEMNNKQVQHGKLKLDTSRSFSVFQINRRTMKPDFALALKRFKRSAARQQQGQQQIDTKDCRRSLKALVMVINHITQQIIDADNMRQKDLAFPTPPGQPSFEFIHIYDFLWDRMRQMIKDIMRLPPKDKFTKQTITICEQIARFFILSINEGRKKYNSKLAFSERMNTESILKVIANLMQFYRESRMNLKNLIQGLSDQERDSLSFEKVEKMMQAKGIYISPFEPQLSAYSFLFSDDRKKQFYQILTIGFQDQQTQSQNPLINSSQMQKALQVHRILTQKNIEQYFQKIQQGDTDYVFACMMLKHLQFMRKQTSKILFKSSQYVPQNLTNKEDIVKNGMDTDTLKSLLRFNESQTEQFNDFVDMMGLQKKGKLLIWREGYMNQDHYLIPDYVFRKNKLDRANWPDSQTKKRIKEPNTLSREELIKCSWKKNDYTKKIIAFYMGRQFTQEKRTKSVKPAKIVQQIHAKMTSISQPKQAQKQKQTIPDTQTNNKSKQDNLAMLNQKRLQLQKKQKRGKFMQQLQKQVLDLYRFTDQVKFMNRKKSLAIIDQWMMYYHDKMLRKGLQKIQHQSRKKGILTDMFRDIKVTSGIKKQFQQGYNKSPYEFKQLNKKNIVPQRTEKGLMSGLIQKAHFKAKKTTYNNIQEIIKQKSLDFSQPQINLVILTTCASSPNIDKILFDLILYLIYQDNYQPTIKLKQIKQAIKKINSKQKQIPNLKVHFQRSILPSKQQYHHSSPLLTINLKIARINDAKSKRKAIIQNSHIIQHLFGCQGLIILRENIKYHATQMILQNFEEFVTNNKSRLLQAGNQQQDEQKSKLETLKQIQMPIILVNVMKKSSSSDTIKPVIGLNSDGTSKYPYLKNIQQVSLLQGTTQPLDLPFILKQKLAKQFQLSRKYSKLYSFVHKSIRDSLISPSNSVQEIYPFRREINLQSQDSLFQVRCLKQVLRQVRINASCILDKIDQQNLRQNDRYSTVKKQFIFSFYQEYFNLCLEQIIKTLKLTYKNCIFFKKWAKYILLAQNFLNQTDFIKHEAQQQYEHIHINVGNERITELEEQKLIQSTLQSQQEYNIITQSFKEYEFLIRILQSLRMKFVGQNIQAIDPDYFIFDDQGVNIFGMPNKKRQANQPERKQVEKTLHMTHFINTIGKYLNLFDSDRTNNQCSDDKFQNLMAIFQQHGLEFKTFDLKTILQKQRNCMSQNRIKLIEQDLDSIMINYQVQGDSLEFFSYLIGYLMQGCKNINIILPKDFKFRLKFENLTKQSMKNLKNVIRVLSFKQRDVFENLKYEPLPLLSKLAFNEYHDGNGDETNSRQPGQLMYDEQDEEMIKLYKVDKKSYDRLGQDEQLKQISQKQYAVQRENNGQSKVGKRQAKYHYRSIYPQTSQNQGFVYCRAQKLNQLQKKLKQQ